MQKATVIIIGGGLAGLTASIHLAKKDISVLLFEKEDYPHHKVCGEYVSREILPYFKKLEIPILKMGAAHISCLQYSTVDGKSIGAKLPLGGLGISRYVFDNLLFQESQKNNVRRLKDTVSDVKFSDNKFTVSSLKNGKFTAEIVFGAFGKRSNLDKSLDRSFIGKPAPWLAVKAHYKKDDFPEDLVALHNFRGGYCGLSKTETGTVNACYLATYESFKKHKNPREYQRDVLRENPFLDDFFSRAVPVFEQPLAIAQVSFSPKKTVENHILMLGDAAGLLHPLCGNGMAMAIHSAKIASEVVLRNLVGPILNREQMEAEYDSEWDSHFKARLRTGKWLQKVLLNEKIAGISQSVVSKMPFLLPQLIKRTHGNPIS